MKFPLIHITHTASSTIDVVATPTDYYENFADLQGGFYFDDTSFLGEYPNVGNSLSTATTDICLDHCSCECTTILPTLLCLSIGILADTKVLSHPRMYHGGNTNH